MSLVGGAGNGRQSGVRAVADETALCDLRLEGEILGSCLVRPELLKDTKLEPADFYSGANAHVFTALLWLQREGLEVGTHQLRMRLQDQGLLQSVGGDAYLLDLTVVVPHVTLPVDRIRRLACKRRIAAAASILSQRMLAGADDFAPHWDALERARDQLREIDQPLGRLPLLADYVDSMRFDGRRLRSGLETFDCATRGGIPPGSFGVIAGAPGAAKTTISTWLADSWQRAGAVVMYVAADESRKGIVVRLGQIDGFPREGLESPHDVTRKAFAAKLRSRPELLIVDPHDDRMTLEDADKMLREVAGTSIRVLIVDSLQTVPCDAAQLADNPREKVNAVIEVCKRAAARGAIVVAISEMSRGGYRTGDKKSDTSALASGKESGSIEYGAAFLLGLRSVRGENGVVDIELAKNRIGSDKPDFRVRLNFERATVCEVEAPAPPDEDQKAAVRHQRAKDRILSTLREHRDLRSAREVLARADGTAAHNLAALNEMIARGEVEKVGDYFRPKPGGSS